MFDKVMADRLGDAGIGRKSEVVVRREIDVLFTVDNDMPGRSSFDDSTLSPQMAIFQVVQIARKP